MALTVSSRRFRADVKAAASAANRNKTPPVKETVTVKEPPRGETVPRNEPTRVNIQGSAKGGTILLIAGTLFVGYLYFTGKLSGVYAAISGPSRLGPGGRVMNPPITAPSGGIGPVVPGTTPGYNVSPGYPRHFFIPIDPRYGNLPPLEISADDPATCAFLVYNGVLQRTQSLTLADTYVKQYCS